MTAAGGRPGGRVTRADVIARREARRNAASSLPARLDGDGGASEAEPARRSQRLSPRTRRICKTAGIPAAGTAGLEAAAAVAALMSWWVQLIIVAGFVAGTMISAVVASHDDSDEALARRLATAISASLWMTIAVPVTFGGVWEIAFRAAPAVGAAVATSHRWARPAPPPPKPRRAITAAPRPEPEPAAKAEEDPLLARFREILCRGKFADMTIFDWRRLGDDGSGGVSFRFALPDDSPGTVADLAAWEAAIVQMARACRVTRDRVLIDYDRAGDLALNPSETDGRVVVSRVLARTAARRRKIDPRISTYDHPRGRFEVASFPDETRAHWDMTESPGDGAKFGLVAAASGRGKTGLCNLIISQYSLAAHEGRRIAAVFAGDTQGSMGHLAGRVPLYAHGPLAVVHMHRIIAGIGISRRAVLAEERRGWSMPGDGWPLILPFTGELPMLFSGPERLDGPRAMELRRMLTAEAQQYRKFCIGGLVESQTTYVDQLGGDPALRDAMEAAWVIAALKCGDTIGKQVGIRGSMAALPDGFGYGYLASSDMRPAEIIEVDYLPFPGKAQPGEVDAQEVADVFAAMPVDLGEPVLRVLRDFGLEGDGPWVVTDDDCLKWEAVMDAADQPPQEPGSPQAALQPAGGSARAIQLVMNAAMNPSAGIMTTRQIMDATGLTMDGVLTACAVLALNGQLADRGEGRWSAP
jgi:hypothetical protein